MAMQTPDEQQQQPAAVVLDTPEQHELTPPPPPAPAPEPTPTLPSAQQDCILDNILVQIGQFGIYQLYVFGLLCVPMVFNAFFSISYAFTASEVVHRCNITQCDSPASGYEEPWLNYTLPLRGQERSGCERYVAKGDSCQPSSFDTANQEYCGSDFKFQAPQERTISNEFGIYCQQKFKLTTVGTVNNIGQFVGIPLGGYLADRYGRRTILAVAGFLSAWMGLLRSYAVSYEMFLVFEFLDMAIGSTLFPTAFLLAIELVGPKRRVAAATLITIFYALGESGLGLLAMLYPNWRHLLRVLYAPALLQLLLLWLLPESVRWLLSQRQEQQATDILRRAAHVNGRKIAEDELALLVRQNALKLSAQRSDDYPLAKSFGLFKSRIANCSLCWFAHTLIALGLSLNSVELDGNKYYNFMLNGLVQIPGLLLPLAIMNRFGRRRSLFSCMLLCALCMGATALTTGNVSLQLTFFFIGKFAITCSFNVLYFYTSEIFPTNVRNSLLSFCSMIGRIGSMIAPHTILLTAYYRHAPQLIFAVFALFSGCLALYFPETVNEVLPTTLEEAQNLGSASGTDQRNKHDSDKVINQAFSFLIKLFP